MMTLRANLHTQLRRFSDQHSSAPRFLVLDPENYRALVKEMGMNGPVISGAVRVLGLQIVVIPIPETFYVAGDPDTEMITHLLTRNPGGKL